jgi:hypothetical protein
MKILKRLGIFIAVIAAIIFIIPLFTKKDFAAERSIGIAGAAHSAFEYVRLLRNHGALGSMKQVDKNVKENFSGTDGNPGFLHSWDSLRTFPGAGELGIRNVVPDERVELTWKFSRPLQVNGDAWIKIEPAGNAEVKVTYGISGRIPYPMNWLLVFFDHDELLGNFLNDRLKKLKNIPESG